MSTKHSTTIPIALSEARRQLDHWRSQQPNKRTRLPKEFWQKAVALAREHGLNKTARTLNVKYYSLRKHLHEAGAAEESSVKPQLDFIELLPDTVTPSGVECMVEWVEGHNATVRMHIKGAGLSELTALARVFRSDRT
jgi:transposase-like protein